MSSVHPPSLREWFAYNDWARDKVFARTESLSDEQLDRAFEIGPGSLRELLRHLYGAERIWYERWRGLEQTPFPQPSGLSSVADIAQAARSLAEARNTFLAGLSSDGLAATIKYQNSKGEKYANQLGDLMQHVVNHGIHHRAQALFVLRQVGAELKPGLDYLMYRLERPTIAMSPETREQLAAAGYPMADQIHNAAQFDPRALMNYLRYNDWAQDLVHTAAALDDAALDREFDIGARTLRKTLLHICDAERWWVKNWLKTGPGTFDKLPETTTLAELQTLFAEARASRDAFVGSQDETALLDVVEAEVKPDLTLRFRLSATIAQLCSHGTHHRAQALNILRRLGARVPALDYVTGLRKSGWK